MSIVTQGGVLYQSIAGHPTHVVRDITKEEYDERRRTGLAVRCVVPVDDARVIELSDTQIVDSREAIKIWGYMTCDEKTCDRLLLEFARSIIAKVVK